MSESIKRNYLDKGKTAWTTPDGTLHLDTVRMCEVLGVPPTAENQSICEQEAIKLFQEKCPGCPTKVEYDLL